MKPTKPINVTGNPSWKYISKEQTSVAKTFARIRKEQKAKQEADQAIVAEQQKKVRTLGKP